MTLTRDQLTVIEGDARIADDQVQRALGYGRVNDLHRIIRRHEAELESYAPMVCRSGKASSGQNTVVYYLTEEQATLVCMFARTPRAAEARRQIVEVFTAWRRGAETALPSGRLIEISATRYIELLEAENALLKAGPVRRPRRRVDPMSEAERGKLIDLIEKGLSLREISSLTGRSKATISYVRTSLRGNPRPTRAKDAA